MNNWRPTKTRSWLRSAGLAALCGSRTMLGPALAAREYRGLRRYQPIFVLMAAGEMLMDKVPGIGNRTMTAPRTGRAITGAAVAVASRPRGTDRGLGVDLIFAAALGAVAASVGTVLTFHLRRVANRALGDGTLANVVTGLLEDGLVVTCGRSLAD